MKVVSVVSEALKNHLSGTGRPLSLLLAFTLLTATLALTDVLGLSSVMKDAESFQRSGASTLVMTGSQIDASICDGFSGSGDFVASGALAANGSIRTTRVPNTQVPNFVVTPGFVELLGLEADQSGIVLSSEAAEALGVEKGDHFHVGNRSTEVSDVYDYPSDGRNDRLSFAALTPTVISDDIQFSECWAKAWPLKQDLQKILLFSLSSGDAELGDVTVSQLNTRKGDSFDADERLASRLSSFSPLMAFGFSVALSVVAIRLRRLEIASALHSGVTKPAVVLQQLLESILWALPSAVIVSTFLLSFSAHSYSVDWGGFFVLGLRSVAMALVGVAVGCIIATSLVREKHLYRYFAHR